MGDKNWAHGTETETDNKTATASLWKLRVKNLIRLVGLIVVALTAWNFFALIFSFIPMLEFWPALLGQYAPASMTPVVQQFVVAVVGAIVVWFV